MKEKIQELINEAIAVNPSLFLIDWDISSDNKIQVLVDGDEGVTIEEIIRISRHIEHNLDRDEFDFALNVLSAGVGEPLLMPRQYKKNIGRLLKIQTLDNLEFEGMIKTATEEDVQLTWETREPKPIGKGKHTVTKEETVKYNNIKKAIIKITF